MKKESTKRSKWFAGISVLFCLIFLTDQNLYSQEYRLGDIPLHPKIYQKYLKVWPLEMLEILPESYDARDDELVTSAKDQGACGSCWAFASVGAMESHILKWYVDVEDHKDLSEQQQVSCNEEMYGCGGGTSSAIKYWELKEPQLESKGPQLESLYPYTANDASCLESEYSQLGYRVIDWHTVDNSTNDFKNSLYLYGPSYWRFNVYSDFFTYWNDADPGYVYKNSRPSNYRGGHAVLIIGWDNEKGAYLCKNSWGEEAGPNDDGTFWIAYDGHWKNLNFGMANFSLTSLTCSNDADCNDGLDCNGIETCIVETATCQEGEPVCPDDGLFCNGDEVCNELTVECSRTGNPCSAGIVCDEDNDQCLCGEPGAYCTDNSQCCSGRCHPRKNYCK